MMNLAEGIKQLPNKMQHLEINLSGNNLGENKECMKYFMEGMKNIPKNIHNLNIDLSDNNF